jgi:small GTP-binding protein
MSAGEAYLKIVVLGAANVGKTALITRYCTDVFRDDMKPTLGTAFMMRVIELPDADVTVMFWDTAGQERFDSITPSYLHGANGLILVFDISDADTFRAIDAFFAIFLEKYGERSDPPPVLLLGNKCDLPRQAVTEGAIAQWCEEHRVYRYWLVSAKTGTNVDGAMNEFIQSLVDTSPDVDPPLIPVVQAPRSEPCC